MPATIALAAPLKPFEDLCVRSREQRSSKRTAQAAKDAAATAAPRPTDPSSSGSGAQPAPSAPPYSRDVQRARLRRARKQDIASHPDEKRVYIVVPCSPFAARSGVHFWNRHPGRIDGSPHSGAARPRCSGQVPPHSRTGAVGTTQDSASAVEAAPRTSGLPHNAGRMR
jgi:hypothetical protein